MSDPKELVTALNLYVLQTVAEIARDDPTAAMIQFSLSEATVTMLATLNPSQIYLISRCPDFLFAIDAESLRGRIKDCNLGSGYEGMHSAVKNIAALLAQGNNDA